jgi:hypothetical protein
LFFGKGVENTEYVSAKYIFYYFYTRLPEREAQREPQAPPVPDFALSFFLAMMMNIFAPERHCSLYCIL